MPWECQCKHPTTRCSLTESVTVATKAQKKLRHIVLMLKVWLISSIENNTPPIGEPKATATPAALAAVIISRIFPAQHGQSSLVSSMRASSTLTAREITEHARNDISGATCYVNRRTFLPDGKARRDDQRLSRLSLTSGGL